MAREPIEPHIRPAGTLDGASVVVRGWPLTVDGLLNNADATRQRFERDGEPLLAVSAEMTSDDWDLERILSGPRLRTRSRYASAPALALVASGFELLPTFAAPHFSVVLGAYDEASAEHLLVVLGEVRRNPHYVGRQP